MRPSKMGHIQLLLGFLLAATTSAHAQFLYAEIVSLCELDPGTIDRESLPDFYVRGLESRTATFTEGRCIVDSPDYRNRPLLGPRNLTGRNSIDITITVRDDDGRRGDDTVDVNPVSGRRAVQLRLTRRGSAWVLTDAPLCRGLAPRDDPSCHIERTGDEAGKRATLRFRAWVQPERL